MYLMATLLIGLKPFVIIFEHFSPYAFIIYLLYLFDCGICELYIGMEPITLFGEIMLEFPNVVPDTKYYLIAVLSFS